MSRFTTYIHFIRKLKQFHSEGLQAVLDGKLQGTMAQGTADQGKLAADACADLLDGKEVDSETIVDNVYYTADNAQEALDAIAK